MEWMESQLRIWPFCFMGMKNYPEIVYAIVGLMLNDYHGTLFGFNI